MGTNQDWNSEWVTFFDEFAGDFHQSFKEKLAKQLFEVGSTETGISGFQKYNFMLLIGQEDLKMQQIDNNVFALVSFITPPALTRPVWIYWTAESKQVSKLHTHDVSTINIQFHWGGGFPTEEVLACLKPYKKVKKGKTGLHFDIYYYHNAFPDISLEFNFTKKLVEEEINVFNSLISEFIASWNTKSKDNAINYFSPLIGIGENSYEVIFDFGQKTPIEVLDSLLKTLSDNLQSNAITIVKVK